MHLKASAGLTSIALVGIALFIGVNVEARREYAIARDHYIEESRASARGVARTVNAALRSIYENLRTLALLPNVRQIDRHSENMDGDSLETIQQIYNNLANSVSVSEVYIVPVDLDPDKIDPVTGKGEEPIRMFDQLIVHAGQYSSKEDPFAAAKAKESPQLRVRPKSRLTNISSFATSSIGFASTFLTRRISKDCGFR